MHVDLDPTTHRVSSNEHGEAFATRNDQDGRSNETQGHSHKDGVNNKQAQSQLNNEERSEDNPLIDHDHDDEDDGPSKDQLKCHILECINPFNGIIPLITYWGASDEG